MDQISQFYLSKKSAQILLAISLFSFLISYFSFFYFLLSTFSMRLLCFFTDRNYIFLLCNGILVFIITSSGFIKNSSQKSDFKDEIFKKSSGSSSSVPKVSEMKVDVTENITEIKKETRTEQSITENVSSFVRFSDEDEDKDQDEDQEEQLLEIEEEETEEIGLPSTEELNKKCDDFIKKMRERIKIEAQHMLMVHC